MSMIFERLMVADGESSGYADPSVRDDGSEELVPGTDWLGEKTMAGKRPELFSRVDRSSKPLFTVRNRKN